MTTDRQREANQANAQHSTGPRTANGKAVSSANGIKHGAYATQHFAIPRGRLAEDPDEVAEYLERITEALEPRDALEREAAFRVAMACLRLRRLGHFEAQALAGDGAEGQYAGSHLGPLETAGTLALRTLDRVAQLEGRTSQSLDRALAAYAELCRRPFDVVVDVTGISRSKPNSHEERSLTA
jgi:hypothetical protein